MVRKGTKKMIKLLFFIILGSKYANIVNYFGVENPLEYSGTTQLYDHLLLDYDSRVSARNDENLTKIYKALDVIWLNKGTRYRDFTV